MTIPHPGFLVWNPCGYRPPTYRHDSLESARAEARRLASQNPGQEFFVMVPVGRAFLTKPEPEWRTMNPLPLLEDQERSDQLSDLRFAS